MFLLVKRDRYLKQDREDSLFIINKSSQGQTWLKPKRDLCQHVSHFLLHQLVPGQWHPELHSDRRGENKIKSRKPSINLHRVQLTASRTCPECTAWQRGSRTQQLPELPMRCHTERCSDSQRDPGWKRSTKERLHFWVKSISVLLELSWTTSAPTHS